jgi:hypothetical protein
MVFSSRYVCDEDRYWVDTGTVANLLLDLFRQANASENAVEVGYSLTVPWGRRPGQCDGQIVFNPSTLVGRMHTPNPQIAGYRFEDGPISLVLYISREGVWVPRVP